MHTFSSSFLNTLERAENREELRRDELIELLRYPEVGPEADRIRILANGISRQRFKNRSVILGQIGYETAPCPGNCRFCAFGADITTLPENRPSMQEILRLVEMPPCH